MPPFAYKVLHGLRQQLRAMWTDDASHPAARQERPWGLSRWVLLVIYMFYAILTSSVYFGWRSMSAMLLRSGQFEWVCDGQPDARAKEPGAAYLCELQDAKIQSLFTVAMASHFTCSALAGWMLDSVGPKVVALVGQLFNTTAWILLGFCSRQFQAIYPAFVFMGAGADVSVYPTLLIVSLFPNNTGVVMALMGACISASFFVPYVLKALWQQVYISFRVLCIIYVIVGPVFCMILALFFVPSKAFKGVDAFKICVEAEKLKQTLPHQVSDEKEKQQGEEKQKRRLADVIAPPTAGAGSPLATTERQTTVASEGRETAESTARETELTEKEKTGELVENIMKEDGSYTEWMVRDKLALFEDFQTMRQHQQQQQPVFSSPLVFQKEEEDNEELIHPPDGKQPSRRVSLLPVLQNAASFLSSGVKSFTPAKIGTAAGPPGSLKKKEVAEEQGVAELRTGFSVEEGERPAEGTAVKRTAVDALGVATDPESAEEETQSGQKVNKQRRQQPYSLMDGCEGGDTTARSAGGSHADGDSTARGGKSHSFAELPQKAMETKHTALSDVADFGAFVDDPRFKKLQVSFSSQSLTFLYFGICIYFIVCGWAMSFYQEAAGRFLSPAAEHNLELLTPLSTFPCIFFGFMINRLGIMSVILTLNSIGLVMYVCVLCSAGSIFAQQLSVVCFFFYVSIFTTQMYVYIESTFDSNHFGKLIGGASMLGGLFSLLSNVLYGDITVRHLSGNTRPVSGALIGLLALMYPLLVVMAIQRQKKSRAQQVEVKKRVKELRNRYIEEESLV